MLVRLAFAACLATTGPALADEATALRPAEAISLHAGPHDMVAYYTAEVGGARVIATFLARTGQAAPLRLVMQLADGDAVSFSLPGSPGTTYRFGRRGSAVTVSAVPTGSEARAS